MILQKPIGIIGQGYVGLEVAISLALKSQKVIGFEKSEPKIAQISKGKSPVENVAESDLRSVLDSGRYEITADFSRIADCSVIVICVPTPISHNNSPDLSMLNKAVEEIAEHLSPDTLIVNESTSFPGTLRNIVASAILSKREELSDSLFFGVAPERVSPGSGIPLSEVSRVISGLDEKSKELTRNFYSIFCREVQVVDTPEIAEAAKLLENTFRKVNISFINEFNLICRELGIDTRKVIEAANTKPYGFMKFDPGAGIGGHCIPVDPLYFQHVAEEIGHKSEFIDLATRANSLHPKRLLDLVLNRSRVQKPRLLILGVAYKPGISDTRESPAELLLEAAKARNLDCGWLDPLVDSWLGSNPSSIDEGWDIALVVTQQPNLPVKELLSRSVGIYDFTGVYSYLDGVVQI